MEKNWKNKKENECYFLRYMLKLSGGVKISFMYYTLCDKCDRHYLIISVDESTPIYLWLLPFSHSNDYFPFCKRLQLFTFLKWHSLHINIILESIQFDVYSAETKEIEIVVLVGSLFHNSLLEISSLTVI